MHIGGYGLQTCDGDVAGQHSIELIKPLREVGGRCAVEVEMRYHHSGMHARVGASGGSHLDGLTKNQGECSLQFGLYGVPVGLNLPTVIGRSVVRKVNEVSLCHCLKRTYVLDSFLRLRIDRSI